MTGERPASAIPPASSDATKVSISAVIPAHNEASGLSSTAKEISRTLSNCVSEWEIIIVDDGSTDDTFTRIKALSESDSRIRGVRLTRNFGKEAALLCGMRAAVGEVVVTIDADLQHPPMLIPEMLDKWREGAKVVHAIKRNRINDSFLTRRRAILFNRILSWMADVDTNNSSDFKLLDKVVVEKLVRELPERERFFRGLTDWIGYEAATVEFDPDPRGEGEGKWSSFKLLELAITAIVSFTSAPLRIVTILGFLTLLIGLILSIEAAVSWFLGQAVSGFVTLILTVLIIGSFIMISLGILGEYVAKIYDEIKNRPSYFVEDTVGIDADIDLTG